MGQYSAEDIAKFVITECENDDNPVDNLKLQKILYFLWLRFYNEKRTELFSDPMEAWRYGPVVPSVYWTYREYVAEPITISDEESKINNEDKIILKKWIEELNNQSVGDLVNKSHKTSPWKEARDTGKIDALIDYNSIKKYVDSNARSSY